MSPSTMKEGVMFGIDWSNADTLLLNLTNLGLGLMLLVALVWALVDVAIDLLEKLRGSRAARKQDDTLVKVLSLSTGKQR